MRVAVLLVLVGAQAGAHQGGTVSKALFTNPPAPEADTSDAGEVMLKPYAFASADSQFTVQWTVDLPSDPTGRFSFYYLAHTPPSAVTYDQILAVATPIPEASGANDFWVSCTCDADAGVVCPDAGPRTHCGETQFTWDTHALTPGAYWIVAANFDYPYKIYTVAGGPVRVAHPSPLPPAAVVVLPNGLFATDTSYTTRWLATGQAPLHFDVFYGVNSQMEAMNPPTLLGTDITPIVNSDSSFSYEWDTTALANGFYYFRVKVTDANGLSTFTDSQLGENVYHPPQDGGLIILRDASPDLSQVVMQPDGCGCQVGGAHVPVAAGLLLAAMLALAMRRRKR